MKIPLSGLLLLLTLPAIRAEEIKLAQSFLVGNGIVEFMPEGYDSSRTPSLILQEEPIRIGNIPEEWSLFPEFYEIDGKTSSIIPLTGEICLYGGGEVTGPLLRNGQEIKLWNTDTGAYSVDGGSRLYQSHPWVIGVKEDGSSFGILFDSTWKSSLTTDNEKISFQTEGAPFRIFIIDRESPQEVLKGLAELTGTIEMPPLWSLGYHQCRFSYDSESKVREIADNFRTREIPCDVIWMDIDYMDGFRIFTFNPERFPNPKGLNDELHQKGFHAVYMIDPGAKVDPDYHVYKSGTKEDIWVKRPDGTIYEGKVWPGYCAFPDFTMPAAREWWAGLYKDFLANGVDGVWNDMNEPAINTDEEWLPENQRTGTMPYDTPHRGGGNLPAGPHLLYHNAYGRLMTESTRNGFLKVYPDRRPFVLTRANLLGGQRYAATWTGDNLAGWEHLKLSVPMSLTLGLSGQPFSGPDIGGFLGNTEPEIWANWIGFGVFLPFARGHACAGTNDKEPWAFGPDIEKSSKMALERRYRLLPYIYTKFYDAHKTGIPVMQPLFFHDPKDLKLREEQEAFLLGEDLMVVPSFANNPSIPSGIWETISLIDGDTEDIYQAQLLQRGGSIIPLGRVIQNTNENSLDPLTLLICLDEEGTAKGRLYWDAGEGWEFKSGDYALIEFEAKRNGDEVTVYVKNIDGNRNIGKEIPQFKVSLTISGQTYNEAGTLNEGAIIKI